MLKFFLISSIALRIGSLFASCDFMIPQVHRAPYFEGWYTKFDSESLRIAIIVGSQFSDLNDPKQMQGMVTVIVSKNDTPSEQWNIFPQDIQVGDRNKPYLWRTGDNSVYISKHEVTIDHPELPMIKLQISQPRPWRRDSPLGPEGLMIRNPFLYSHWFVYSMASKAELEIHDDGKIRTMTGMVHQEKNWGSGFPKHWIWAQGRDYKGTSFTFAGGNPPTRLKIPLDVFALNIKNEKDEYRFAPQVDGLHLAGFRSKLKTDCKSYFRFSAKTPDTTFDLRLSSNESDFFPIYGVLERGWERVARESFHSTAEVTLIIARFLEKLLPNAAMEFGGACSPR